MRRGKNQIRLLAMVVLTALTLLAFWWIQPENNQTIASDIFQVEDLSAISRVELADDTSNVVLAFDGSKWRVNNRYDADGSLIRVLFATLQQAQPKRTAARAHQDSIFNRLAKSGVKVSLFAGEELKRRFYAGGNASRTQAYFADPETREVYVMTIPGYRVYVSGILELNENGWRDKYVFGFNWENFKSLEVVFPANSSDNFTVSMSRDFFGIEGMPEADTSRLNNFLDDVSLLTVEEYLTIPELTDSIQQETPNVEIRVTDIGNRTYQLRMFNFGPRQEVYGLIHEAQLALFSRKKYTALLKPKSYFRKK